MRSFFLAVLVSAVCSIAHTGAVTFTDVDDPAAMLDEKDEQTMKSEVEEANMIDSFAADNKALVTSDSALQQNTNAEKALPRRAIGKMMSLHTNLKKITGKLTKSKITDQHNQYQTSCKKQLDDIQKAVGVEKQSFASLSSKIGDRDINATNAAIVRKTERMLEFLENVKKITKQQLRQQKNRDTTWNSYKQKLKGIAQKQPRHEALSAISAMEHIVQSENSPATRTYHMKQLLFLRNDDLSNAYRLKERIEKMKRALANTKEERLIGALRVKRAHHEKKMYALLGQQQTLQLDCVSEKQSFTEQLKTSDDLAQSMHELVALLNHHTNPHQL